MVAGSNRSKRLHLGKQSPPPIDTRTVMSRLPLSEASVSSLKAGYCVCNALRFDQLPLQCCSTVAMSRFVFLEGAQLPPFQGSLCIQQTKKLNVLRHQPGPACLMTRTQSGPIVTVEVFKELQVIAPVGVRLELLCATVDRTSAVLVSQEDTSQPVGQLFAHFKEVHHLSRSRRTFDLKVVSVIQVELQESPDDHRVDWHPDWTTPV